MNLTHGSTATRTTAVKKSRLLNKIYTNRSMYLFVAPAMIYYLLFHYAPLYFIQIAFRDYSISKGVLESPWAGMKYFGQLFSTQGFMDAFRNNIILGFYKIAFGLTIALVVALMLNEVIHSAYKMVIQTAIYLPHFLSWAVVGSILYTLFSIDAGLVNNIIQSLGGTKHMFLADVKLFRLLVVLSHIWKEVGWGTILFLVSLTNIPSELYEAANIDGAGRLRQMLHITLPGVSAMFALVLILSTGNIFNYDFFQQILVLLNDKVVGVGDILDTFVFRTGLQQGRLSYAAAAGLFKSLISLIFVLSSDFAAKKLGHEGLL